MMVIGSKPCRLRSRAAVALARCVLLTLALSVQATAATPRLDLLPKIGLADEPVHVRLSGLMPQQKVEVTAALRDDRGILWMARAEFLASAQGEIDNATDAPVGGSYTGVDVTGLVWSMTPQGVDGTDREVHFADPLGPITVEVWAKLLTPGDSSGNAAPLLEGSVTRVRMAPGVTRKPVREAGLVGELFLPPGPGPYPGVVAVGGSGGGLNPRTAAMLASRGYAALALAYFRYEGVPRAMVRIPLEYFDQALEWLGDQPAVDRSRLAFMGGSRGGELALLVASHLPRARGVVAIVPSHVMWGNAPDEEVPVGSQPSWSFKGKALPYVHGEVQPLDKFPDFPSLFLYYLRTNPEQAKTAAIPVERSRAQILLVSSGGDEVWPSRLFSEAVVERMQRAGKGAQVRHVTYDHAGHVLARPHILPTTNLWSSSAKTGSTAAGNARAQAEAWPAVLRFLNEVLAPEK